MTTDPNATCQTPGCGHAQDEHSRLSGCLARAGNSATLCPCPSFTYGRPDGMDLPVTPYDGGTSSGHSGTTTSHQRALTEDANGTTKGRQEKVLMWLAGKENTWTPAYGLTVKELREATGWHHGQASSALSNLHKAGRIVRLTEVRDRCKVYTLPEYVLGRATERAGERPAKTRTPKSRGPITLTPAEADALRRVGSTLSFKERAHLASPGSGHMSVSLDDMRMIVDALEARSREPRA